MIVMVLFRCMQYKIRSVQYIASFLAELSVITTTMLRDLVKTCINVPIALDAGRTVDQASSLPSPPRAMRSNNLASDLKQFASGFPGSTGLPCCHVVGLTLTLLGFPR